MAAGLTAEALSKQVADKLAEFMSTPTVSVQVKEINSYHIFAVGEVGQSWEDCSQVVYQCAPRNILCGRFYALRLP